ncbi:MAG: hypothetical protein HQ579_04445 [Candidatus Omnitrophica bacterium]|nr:hypothetical protein [Candidatus Omnitrophota bacterium]
MVILLLLIVLFSVFAAIIVFSKQMQYWIFSYIKWIFTKKNSQDTDKPVDIIFCVVDHFEPSFKTKDPFIQKERIKKWVGDYPKFANVHRDSNGYKPKHTWFFSYHDDNNGNLEDLLKLCRQGFGEIEVHLHHDHIPPYSDTSETFEKKIKDIIERSALLGIFGSDKTTGRRRFGFVHGDWALDNSRGGKYCGINNELEILSRCGCYADFTFPSLCESQPRKINSIYYASDDPKKPKSYNSGTDVRVGGRENGDLMIMQGPLGLRYKKKGKIPFVAIEASNISKTDLPISQRIDFWIKSAIGVKGRPNWVFIKVHTHGALEDNADVLLGEHMHKMYSYLESKYNDGKKYGLHYVTAREFYNIVKAAEKGLEGNPCLYRDYVIDKPPFREAA